MSNYIHIFAAIHLFLSCAFILSMLFMSIYKGLGYTKGDWKWIVLSVSICLCAPYWLLIIGFIGFEKQFAEMIKKMKLNG